jgi:hypothetical protein
MKKAVFFIVALLLCMQVFLPSGNAQDSKTKIILLIAEQNIGGPQRGWWASEIDLSATEAKIAQALLEQGYEVIEPSGVTGVIEKTSAFRVLNLSDRTSVKLGNMAHADYVILGKAIASAGGNVPQSSMLSCFANITAKLIRVKDRKVIAYLEASGSSAHMDTITGGKEALVNAGSEVAAKVIEALCKQGGK